MMNDTRTPTIEVFAAALIISLYMMGAVAHAHRVNVFAWVEGDTVTVESKFSGGRKVNEGRVTVLDPQGSQLLTGTTDEQGHFSFKVPAQTDLRIVLVAGSGHRGEWTIPVEEIIAARPAEPEKNPAPPDSDQTPAEPVPAAGPAAPPSISGPQWHPEALEAVIESALDKKLKPIVRMLAESRQTGPTMRDIFGGIGYILGLVGIAAYVHSRKK